MASGNGRQQLSASGQEWRQNITCSVCLQLFVHPKYLPCGHTFCLKCLRQLAAPRQVLSRQRKEQKPNELADVALPDEFSPFVCPTCRHPVVLPSGGVEEFKVNFIAEAEVARQIVAAIPCDTCDGRAEAACGDCQKRLCPKCRHIHDQFAGASFHSFTPLNQDILADEQPAKPSSSSGGKLNQKNVCKTHAREADLVCGQCDVAVCSQCQTTSHRGHVVRDLPTVMERMRSEMQGLLQKVQNEVKIVDQVVEERNKEVQELKRQEEEMVRQTVEAAGKVTAWANQAEDNAVAQINAISEPIKTKLVQQKTDALERKNILNQLRQCAKFIVQSGSFVELKSVREQVEASLSVQPCSDSCQAKAAGGTANLFERHSSGQEVLQTTVPRFVGEVTSFPADGKQKTDLHKSETAWGFYQSRNLSGATNYTTLCGLTLVTFSKILGLEMFEFAPEKTTTQPSVQIAPEKTTTQPSVPVGSMFLCATSLPSSDILVITSSGFYVGRDIHHLVRAESPEPLCVPNQAILSHDSMPNGRHAYLCYNKHPGVWEIKKLTFKPPLNITAEPIFQMVRSNISIVAFDVSSDAKYFAVLDFTTFSENTLAVAQVSIFEHRKAEPCAVFHSPKTVLDNCITGDVCFSLYNGKEMLRVAVCHEDTVYILDFRNNCAIVGKTPLRRPRCVRADAAGRTWVVCEDHVVAFISAQ